MAGHGGGGGGHGGGGGGGGKKKGGLMAAITGNGCLRYLALYVVALILLAGLAIANGLGLFSKLGLPVPSGPAASINSQGLSPNTGGSAPSTGGSTSSVAATAGGMISSAPVTAATGSQITSMTAPAFYIVQPGETIDTVAAKFGLSAQQLYDYNRLTNRMLLAGQVLYLPPPGNPSIPGTGRNAGRTDAAPEAGGGDGTP